MALSITLTKLLLGRSFTTERGRIRLFERMDWCLIPAKALAENFQNIAEKNGKEYLYELGYQAGRSAAEEMVKFMGLIPKAGWSTQNAVIALLEFLGFGTVEFLTTDIKKSGHHHVILRVKDNPVIEHARTLYGSKSKVCYWFMGVYSAHGEMELGLKHARLKENVCYCKGAPYCKWETKW